MEPKDQRKAKTTPETRAESVRLLALWEASEFKISQAAFGDRYEIGSQPAVGFFLNGQTPLSLKAAQGFARGLRIDIDQFSPRLAAQARGIALSVGQPANDFVEVRRLNVALSAGPGAKNKVYEELGSLSFRRDFLEKYGVTMASAKIAHVEGTSMEPTLPDGSVVLINRANTQPINGKIFALVKGGNGLVIKRLVKAGHAWYARSDNPDGNPDFPLDDSTPILGRAVWVGIKL